MVVSSGSVAGPLAGYVAGFGSELAVLGYSARGAEAQLGLMRDLSRWLAGQGLAVGDLDEAVVARFVADRRRRVRGLRSALALAPLLGFLRRAGVVRPPVAQAPASAVEVLLEGFAGYLRVERGVAPATVRSYVSLVRGFVGWRLDRADGRWDTLTAVEVDRFVAEQTCRQRPGSVRTRVNALRALLRWLAVEGDAPPGLADGLGPVAVWGATASPRGLTPDEVTGLLSGLSADGPARCRDAAMVALMWRMGLRAGEVAGLRLDDLDWRAGVVVVHGKGGRRDRVPLPVDVGDLLVAYLRRARPPGSTHRYVFVAVDAPHGPLGACAVSSVVARAARRASLPGACRAHRLRHTAACRVLAAGGGLVEAGQLLRHTSVAATAVYARSDLAALAVLARPWPIGGQS